MHRWLVMNCLDLFWTLSAGEIFSLPLTVTSDEERSCEVTSSSVKMIRYCFQIKEILCENEMKFVAIYNEKKIYLWNFGWRCVVVDIGTAIVVGVSLILTSCKFARNLYIYRQ